MYGWSSGTLQSSTRSGFVVARRWQSAHSLGAISASFLPQQIQVGRAAILAAHRVQNELNSFQPAAAEQLHHHLDHFRIDHRRFRADGLRADLEELAETAFLRALAAEHRAHVVELLDAGNLVQAMLDIRAHHRRGRFGTKRQRAAVAILPGVHFLADDVGVFADAAREQRRLFEQRRADFLVVIGAEDFARHGLDVIPRRAGGRKNIAGSLDRANRASHSWRRFFLGLLAPLHVSADALLKALLLFRAHRTTRLGGRAHHQHVRRDLHPFGNQRTGGHHRSTADAGAVQHRGAHPDQAVFFDGAAVQDRRSGPRSRGRRWSPGSLDRCE